MLTKVLDLERMIAKKQRANLLSGQSYSVIQVNGKTDINEPNYNR